MFSSSGGNSVSVICRLFGLLVVMKKTWARFSGYMRISVNISTANTTIDAAKTNVIILDNKIGGSMRFGTDFPSLIIMYLRKKYPPRAREKTHGGRFIFNLNFFCCNSFFINAIKD